MGKYIIDTTLRDGEQAPGVAFTMDEKLKVASLLNELGVDEVEVGTPAISFEEQKAIQVIASAGFSFKTSSWCRAKVEDIQVAARLKTDSINISLPVSDIQINTLGKSREWVISELKKVVAFAKQFFNHVTLGAQDATRSNPKFLKEYIFYAVESGADRVRIADTVGIFDIFETQSLFSSLKKDFPSTNFEFHGHNDLGMATANAIAALKAGANCISATINGLGERAGNTVLEEIIAYFKVKEKVQKYNTKTLKELSAYVGQISGKSLSDNKPITGDNIYNHESGIHTSAMIKNVSTYQFLNPDDFGAKPTSFIFGKHSGKASVIYFFNSKGLPLNERQADYILCLTENFVLKNKRPVTETELLSMYLNLPNTNITTK